MCPNDSIVCIPRQPSVSGLALAETHVWPILDRTLRQLNADAVTREAACAALASSEGCIVLANYLNSEVKRSHRADYRFKVPLLVLAAHRADQDDGVDLIYDPAEGALYAETDNAQYSFHIFKDWTVDWEAVAHETIPHYAWSGIEQQTWALDALLRHAA
ncbi:MAG: hypothetical protein RhofKO_03710 [Rhodothermales bacterium]